MRDWILHVDMDQFLAAVEKRRLPHLREQPLIVGGSGDPTQPRQVVACASYEARAFGVHAGMPLRLAARKCRDATFLPSDAPFYEQASAEVMATLHSFPVRVEVWGWDEAFLGAHTENPEALAADIQRTVAATTGLSCSIGIGDNKLHAKHATGFAKPAGIYRITAETWMELMGERPTGALWGIGRRIEARLANLGVHTVADLASAQLDGLATEFGPAIGPSLRRVGRGEGSTAIRTAPREPRSRSRATTYPHDLTDRVEIDAGVGALAKRVGGEVIAEGRAIIRVAVTVRTATFYTRTKITTLKVPTTDVGDVEDAALAVLDRFDLDRPVRLLAVRVDLMPQEGSGAT